MKIITLWQPWASLIALQLKQYETRSWSTKYRGAIAIHASKTQPCNVTEQLYEIFRLSNWDSRIINDFEKDKVGFRKPLPQGCILAVADLVDCLRMSNKEPEETGQINNFQNNAWEVLIPAMTPLEKACGDWQEGRFAWKFNNIVRLSKPIPYKGGQGLRDINMPELEEIWKAS